MDFWVIFLGFVVVCLAILMYTRKFKIPAYEGYGNIMDEAMAFGKFQDGYFHDLTPTEKGLFINGNLSTTGLNDSLAQPELYLPKSPDRDYTTYFAENPEYKYKEKNEFCKTATIPNDLPAHGGALLECGWYYLDDPSKPSMGLVGTREGALFLEDLPQNGEWIWDLSVAQQKEEVKLCKRMKSCFLVDLDDFKDKCGFCKNKGHGVPIFPSGQEKYKDAAGNFCGEPLIVNSSKCLQPVMPVIKTSSGISCGSYGYASSDNSTRLYTESDCNALGGTYRNSGECLDDKNGGSFSTECRSLNVPFNGVNPVSGNSSNNGNGPSGNTPFGDPSSGNFGASVPNVCTPNAAGGLTAQCLLSIAKGLGFSETGTVIRLITTHGTPTDNESIAIDTLEMNGIPVPKSIIGGAGNIDTLTAGNAYNKIYTAMTAGSTPKIKAAATLLVNGDVNFDPCSIESLGNDPIPTRCLQREFRKVGCQASGAAYPTDSTAGSIKTMPIGDVRSTFQNLYNSMKNAKDSTNQYKAVKDCLGIQYKL